MKKYILLLLLTVAGYGQTLQSPTYNKTTTNTLVLKTNTESATGTNKIPVQETDGQVNWIQSINIPIPYVPTGYLPTAPNIGGHFTGINNKLNSIVATTAGLTTRVWFTADVSVVSATNYYATNATSKGTLASAIQNVVNNDNVKTYFAQDLIGTPFVTATLFPPGVYAGNLSASTSPNSAQQRWTVELYKCDNAGTPIASGVTGAPVGSLGVTVITILDSGLLTLADGSVTNVQVSGNLGGTGLSMAVGERVRYHVSAEKVGTAGANITQSVYYGTSYNSYIDVPVPLNTTAVQNLSGVVGATTTDALNTLNSAIPVSYSKIVYVNNNDPNSATIFDLNNPPTVNDNALKTNVNNLYIGLDASGWVYNSTSLNYVTKTVTSATSNFYLAGTTTDAGNSKTAHITRTGNIGADTFIKNASAINNTYASVVNNSLVIGNRGVGAAAPSIMSRTASSTITAMNLITMQTTDVARTAESDLSFRNGYEAGGDAILGYSSAGSAFGFYNGADITLNGFRNGNININPPGTLNPTNAGFRLDVGGTARIQSTLTTAADIMSTGVVQTNSRFTAISPYTSGQVGTAGVSIQIAPRTITNSATATSGTVAQHVNNGFLIPTFSATNTGVTYTNASNVYIDGAPTAGTNVTITNPWAFYVNAGNSYFGSTVRLGTSPTASAGGYEFLTRNTTSGNIEKIASANVALLASPTFTGNPIAPTPTAGDNDTSIATTAFVTNASNWTKTGNDIRNNNSGDIELKPLSNVSVLNSGNTVVSRMTSSGSFVSATSSGGFFGVDSNSGMNFNSDLFFVCYGSSQFKFNPIYLSSTLAGTQNIISFANETVNPTSGNHVFNFFNSSPIINQTGGANGITRSIYINPTLTSAADYRAIEVTNGNTILQKLKLNAPTYANDAAADADATLLSGMLYKITGSRAVYQKP
jgi:hypothetical protein